MNTDRELLRQSVIRYNNMIAESVERPVREKFGIRPDTIDNVFSELKDLMNLLGNSGFNEDQLSERQKTMLKSAVFHYVSAEKSEAENRLQKTSNQTVRLQIQNDLDKAVALESYEWLQNVNEFSTPKLEDYLDAEAIKNLQNDNFSEDDATEMQPKGFWSNFNHWLRTEKQERGALWALIAFTVMVVVALL